jgi:hypothetical protein
MRKAPYLVNPSTTLEDQERRPGIMKMAALASRERTEKFWSKLQNIFVYGGSSAQSPGLTMLYYWLTISVFKSTSNY